MGTPLLSTESAKNAISRVRYSHDGMIDLLIANPAMKQKEIALRFGVTESWLSRIFCSDAFNHRLAERKGELVDPFLLETIEDNLKGLIMQSTNVLAEKLEASRSPELALRSLDIAGKMMGYGARKENVTLQQNFIAVVPTKAGSVSEWVEAHKPAVKAVFVEEATVKSAELSQLSDLARLAGT